MAGLWGLHRGLGRTSRASNIWRICAGPVGLSAPGVANGRVGQKAWPRVDERRVRRRQELGDGWDDVSSHPHRSPQVVSRRLSDGPRQARRLSQVSAAGAGVAYQTASTVAHKRRHGLSQDPARPLHGLLEADESFIGGRGHSTKYADKSLVVAAIEKPPAPKNKQGQHRRPVTRQHGFFAGRASGTRLSSSCCEAIARRSICSARRGCSRNSRGAYWNARWAPI